MRLIARKEMHYIRLHVLAISRADYFWLNVGWLALGMSLVHYHIVETLGSDGLLN